MAVGGSQVVWSFGVFSDECLLLTRCGTLPGDLIRKVDFGSLLFQPHREKTR